MKDIQIPSSRRQASQLSCHFPLHLFSHTQSENVKGARFSTSQSLHCRGRIMDARVYEAGMQTRPRREKEKRIVFLFRRQNRYYSAGPARVPTWKRAPWPPVDGWMDGTTDGRARQTPYDGISKDSFHPSSRLSMLYLISIRVTRLQLNRYITYIRPRNKINREFTRQCRYQGIRRC